MSRTPLIYWRIWSARIFWLLQSIVWIQFILISSAAVNIDHQKSSFKINVHILTHFPTYCTFQLLLCNTGQKIEMMLHLHFSCLSLDASWIYILLFIWCLLSGYQLNLTKLITIKLRQNTGIALCLCFSNWFLVMFIVLQVLIWTFQSFLLLSNKQLQQ